MDRYFAKFTRSTPKAQPTGVMQLAKFHRSWNYIHNVYFIEDKRANVSVNQTQIPQHLKTMVDLLVDEEIRQDADGTGVCMEYLMRNGVLTILVNIADADFPDGLRGEAVRTITNMINLLDEKFLVHGAVFKPTLKLIRSCVEDPVAAEKYHEDLVDLMYVICSKIHGFPDLLNIFFHDRTWLRTPMKRSRASNNAVGSSQTEQVKKLLFQPTSSKEGDYAVVITDQGLSPTNNNTQPPATPIMENVMIQPRRSSLLGNNNTSVGGSPNANTLDNPPPPDYEFLLFTYLLQFLHREGKSGDYARTALLFIIELANGALGEFVLHASSFPAVAAAAVGALYSQLPRSLLPPETEEEDEEEKMEREDFRMQLDGFTKSLIFCQDVIDKCPNTAVGDVLLQHVRNVFLENILWPSLCGCVDYDGSAEAVITYLDIVLRSLREPRMTLLVLDFLKMKPDTQLSDEDLFIWERDEMEDLTEKYPNEGFDLRRLVLDQLSSDNEGAVTASMNLLQTILTKFCNYSRRIVTGVLIPSSKHVRHSIYEHEREIDLYMSVISALNPLMNRESLEFISGYDKYLWEAEMTLEMHKKVFHDPRVHGCYQVDAKSPLCRHLVKLLVRFFENSRRLNLALSGVIAALAQCPCRDLDGWLACSDINLDGVIGRIVPEQDSDSDSEGSVMDDNETFIEQTIPVETMNENDGVSVNTSSTVVMNHGAELAPVPAIGPPPPLYRTLELLAAEVADLRSEFPEFEIQLRQRRKGLLVQAIAPAPSQLGDEKTLVELVDGTVMLEEMVKEWLSLMQARRALGVDLVRFE